MSADLEPPVRLLTVCTGNVCRSPYAAMLLQQRLNEVRPGSFLVSSAGTHALVGNPVDPGSAALLATKGVDGSTFRATLLSSAVVRSHDAVLVMTEAHRDGVIEEAPFAFRRTYLIRELAHQLDVIGERHPWPLLIARESAAPGPLGRWRALPSIIAAESRSIRRRLRDQHVTDPIGRSARTFAQMGEELDSAIDRIVRWEASFPV